MVRNIVFAHKFDMTNIVRIEPPILPMAMLFIKGFPLFGNADITDGGVKPNIKNFVFKTGLVNRKSPFQIAGDATFLQSFFEPFQGDGIGNFRPKRLFGFYPSGQFFFQFRQVEKQMLGFTDFQISRTGNGAASIYQFSRL